MEGLQLLKQKNIGEEVKKLFDTQGPLCDSEGFYQHEGECWNDALQMIFLYCDGFKERVQQKLANDSVDPAEVDELFRPEAEDLLKRVEENEKTIVANNASRIQFGLLYTSLIYEYLNSLQKRFYRHYYAESLRLSRVRQDEVCSLEEMKGLKALQQLREISLGLRAKGQEGILAAFFGQHMELKNLTERRNPKKLQEFYKPGGTKQTEQHVIDIFKRFFQLPFHIKETRTTYKSGAAHYVDSTTRDRMTFTSKTNALFCGIGMKENSHAVAFYTCGGREFYYDDNHGTIQFPWKAFFEQLQEKKTSAKIESEKAWKRKTKEKYVEGGEYVEKEIFFNGEFVVTNSQGNLLLKIDSYPYFLRKAWEYDSKTLFSEYSTLLWNGEKITLMNRYKNTRPTFKKTFQTANGEELTISLVFEVPEDILAIVWQFETEGLPIGNQKPSSQTGSILGSRLYSSNSMIYEITIEEQLRKIKEGKAKIDDIFYEHTHKYNPLLLAIKLQNAPLVKKILDMNANVNFKIDYRSPLYYAVTTFGVTNLEILKYLLDSGADINDSTNGMSGFTPLMGCILGNEGDELLDTLEFLLKNGADVKIQTKRYNATAIEYALFVNRYQSVIDLLVAYGATLPTCPTKEKLLERKGLDTAIMVLIRERRHIQAGLLAKCYREYELFDLLNFENAVGDTALKLAIQTPDTTWTSELMEFLIRNGADPNYVDRFESTPLHYAIALKKKEAVEKLLEDGAKPNLMVKGFGTPLQHALKMGDPEIIKAIQKEMNRPRYRKLELATRKRKKELKQPSKRNYKFKKRVTLRPTLKVKANV